MMSGSALAARCAKRSASIKIYENAARNNSESFFAIALWDSGSGKWTLQKLTMSASKSNGPAATSGPAACVFNQQQHIGYTDSAGAFWDAWYDGPGDWSLQEINTSHGVTNIPAAAGGAHPYIWVVGQQQHFTYTDPGGTIYDAYWQTPSGGGFSLGGILGGLGDTGDDGDDGGDGDDLRTIKKPGR